MKFKSRLLVVLSLFSVFSCLSLSAQDSYFANWFNRVKETQGRVVDVRVSGLVAQVTLSVGGQLITSLITSGAVREMQLKKGQTAAALIKATEVMIIRV